MFLHRIHLDPRCREARRDLSDPYQLHSTLCRAFSPEDTKCPEGAFLWRIEPETDPAGCPRILVQSQKLPNWSDIGIKGWLARADPAVNLKERLKLDSIKTGQRFRFRMRANPCLTRNGKRLGLFKLAEQESWIARKARLHGFSLPLVASFGLSESSKERADVRISQGQMLRAKQHNGNEISIYSVLYDGVLAVTVPDEFKVAIQKGIGHGKATGLGLLSVAPLA
jgi:CRISPR system Cascade subunit CasE